MGCRDDGDRLFGDIDTVSQAGLVNVREAVHNERGRLVGDIQVDAVGSLSFHFPVDGARYDISGRERF